MSRFGHLSKYDTSAQTTWVEVPELGSDEKPARLQLSPAAESNKPYFNALLRLSGKRARRLQKKQVTVADIEQNRLEDAQLFPKYIIRGWEGVIDEAGNEVPHSQEAASEMCQALVKFAPNVFDRIRDAAGTLEEFYEEDETLPDTGDLVPNS